MQFIPGSMGRVPAIPADPYYRMPEGTLMPATLTSRSQWILHVYVWNDCLSGAQQSHDRTIMRPFVDNEAIDSEMDQIKRALGALPLFRPAKDEDDDTFLSRVIDAGWNALKDAGCDQYRRV